MRCTVVDTVCAVDSARGDEVCIRKHLLELFVRVHAQMGFLPHSSAPQSSISHLHRCCMIPSTRHSCIISKQAVLLCLHSRKVRCQHRISISKGEPLNSTALLTSPCQPGNKLVFASLNLGQCSECASRPPPMLGAVTHGPSRTCTWGAVPCSMALPCHQLSLSEGE